MHMDEVTQQNAALVEEAAASAKAFEEQADRDGPGGGIRFELGDERLAAGAAAPASAPRGRHAAAPAGRAAARTPPKRPRGGQAAGGDDEWRNSAGPNMRAAGAAPTPRKRDEYLSFALGDRVRH